MHSRMMDIWAYFLLIEPGAVKYVRPSIETFGWGWRLDFVKGDVFMFLSIDASEIDVTGAYYVCSKLERVGAGQGDVRNKEFIEKVTWMLDRFFVI